MKLKAKSFLIHCKIFRIKDSSVNHTVSSEVLLSLSEYEFATFYFDEKTCEIAMRKFFREIAAFF